LNIDEAIRAAERIERHGHRAGDVVKSIRALTRKATGKMVKLDVNAVIAETLDLLRSELRQNEISLETEFPSSQVVILGDRVQLQQVILNLIKNGIEAMDGPQHRPRVLCVSSHFDGASSLEVAVSDSGGGFNPDTADNMFDAFFTTKPDGIGLGLSICRSIVEAHGGHLSARSNFPKGSVFCFKLPAASGEAPDHGGM
jgi:signal transduction histidine kinase